MNLLALPGQYGIYKLKNVATVLESTNLLASDGFWTLSRSQTETTLICAMGLLETECVAQQEGWKGIYFDGTLDFGLVGILSGLVNVLATAGIGVLAVSTFDTDYVFVPANHFALARRAMDANGYTLNSAE